MSLSIYTYSNPYEMDSEPYWDSIRYAAHICVSQTMVNGLEAVYADLRAGQLSTVEYLTEAFYAKWDDTKTYIEQYAALSNALDRARFRNLSEERSRKTRQALKFNKTRMLDSIRLLAEMHIHAADIKVGKLTEEQRYLVAAYRMIMDSEDGALFSLPTVFEEQEVDRAIIQALHCENDKKGIALDAVDFGTVVFHGIHQFTPNILNVIEQTAKYKRVIMLFNYQEQYKEVYQTWLDVYSCFDLVIKSQIGSEFQPNTLLTTSYRGNLLGDSLARLAGGALQGKPDGLKNVSVMEFDNITEFSAYVAGIYEEALERYGQDAHHGRRSVLSYMPEQFYAAENSVNDILKVYFPEQFGERHFLAYPIGHFFVAVTNMWNAEEGGIRIEDLNDIAECLCSEALEEKEPGRLITTFNAVKNYFPKDQTRTIEQMISLLRDLVKQIRKIGKDNRNKYSQIRRLGYYNVDVVEVEDLIQALITLNEITKFFYEDFEDQDNNFSRFYVKIREFVEQRILPGAEAEGEFRDIIVRLLARLEEADRIEGRGSFDCLKETMSYYLKQESRKGESANWIVRDFQQIDGDVLQSTEQAGKVIYHFACVSDEDMNVKREDQFPWPLDVDFFEKACEPLDWKFQVYVKSRREFKHFKRYALIYGLEFNRCDFRISYVKHDDEEEKEPYYLLQLLGIRPAPHSGNHEGGHKVEHTVHLCPIPENPAPYTDMDCYRKKICPYRFALESVLEDGTYYRDTFLQKRYYETVLENNVRTDLEGQPASDGILDDKIQREADRLKPYFRFVSESERADIRGTARRYIKDQILKNRCDFPKVSDVDRERMVKRENFLTLRLVNDQKQNVLNGKFEVSGAERKQLTAPEILEQETYEKRMDLWCGWCPEREVCLEPYRSTEWK